MVNAALPRSHPRRSCLVIPNERSGRGRDESSTRSDFALTRGRRNRSALLVCLLCISGTRFPSTPAGSAGPRLTGSTSFRLVRCAQDDSGNGVV